MGTTVLHIDRNHWLSGEPSDVELVLAVLASNPLRPDFEDLFDRGDKRRRMPFVGPARCAVHTKDASTGWKSVYTDGAPIYPDAPDALRFWGNFANLSRVFCIDTNDAAVIAKLTAAINANMASDAYRSARAEHRKWRAVTFWRGRAKARTEVAEALRRQTLYSSYAR